MKTPEIIKKGLECCNKGWQHCNECPYYTIGCDVVMCGDALEYIKQLEAERDAAVKDLSLYAMCAPCKHSADERNGKCPYKDDCLYGTEGHFEWRGVQKEDGNAKSP